MPKPAAEYIRMSTLLQENSPETQRALVREKLPKDLEIVATYEDRAISGGLMERRPGLLQMLLDAEAKKFEAVVFVKYDRAFRNNEEQAVTLNKLRRMGIAVHSILDPPGDGAAGNLIVGILGVVNQFERELTGERIYHANRQLAKQGRWTGARRTPLGYDYDSEAKRLVVNPEEAELVRLVYQTYIDCEAGHSAAKRLRAMGYVTKFGNPWTGQAVTDLVSNEMYIGKLRWGQRRRSGGKARPRSVDYEVFDGTHEAIIDEATFARAQAIRQARRTAPRSASSPHLLSALGRCSMCNSPIVSGSPGNYRCQSFIRGGCKGWSRKATYLEGTIYALVLANIKASSLPAHIRAIKTPAPSTRNIEKALTQLNTQLNRQMVAYESGAYTIEEFRTRRAKIEDEKREMLRQMESVKPAVTAETLEALRNFEELWSEADVISRRKLLRSLVERYESDGFMVKVYFKPLEIEGWQKELASPLIRYDYVGYEGEARRDGPRH
jgi:site-specific DNA recombinase